MNHPSSQARAPVTAPLKAEKSFWKMLYRWRAALLAPLIPLTMASSCSSGSFSLNATPSAVSLQQGASTTVTVNIERAGGFSGPVQWNGVSGLPDGVTASFPETSTSASNSTLNLNASSSAALGEKTVTVRANGAGATPSEATTTFKVTVTAAPSPPPPPRVATVTVSPNPASVAVGGVQAFTAVARDAVGSVVSTTFTWASSNTAVATIDATSGAATGVSAGNATITATADGVNGTAALTVTTPPPPPSTGVWDSSSWNAANWGS